MRVAGFAKRAFKDGVTGTEKAQFASRLNVGRIGWDSYDSSIELHDVAPDRRLTDDEQRLVHEAGFCKAYCNHTDGWETHYSFWPRDAFKAGQRPWRVRYGNRQSPPTKGIQVEEHIPDWPQDWFDSGYVEIVEAST